METKPAAPQSAGNKAPPVPAPLVGMVAVRRLRSCGHAVFGWARKRGLVQLNPFDETPREGREVAREKVLSDAEIGEVWRAAGGLGGRGLSISGCGC